MPPDNYIVHDMYMYIAHPQRRKPQAYPRKPQSLTRRFRPVSLALIVGAELNQNMDLVAIKASGPSSSTDTWLRYLLTA